MKDQIALLKQISTNEDVRNKIESFIEENHNISLNLNDDGLKQLHYQNILSNLHSLAQGLKTNRGFDFNATMLYFSLDLKLYSQIPEDLTKSFVNFIFKDEMFKKGSEHFEFNGRLWKKIFADEQRGLINFFKQNIELLPDSAQKFLEGSINTKKINTIEFPFNEINNDFNYKAFLAFLPPVINLEIFYSFIKMHNRTHNGKAKAKTIIYLYKAIEDKYSDYLESDMVIRFKADLLSRATESLKHELGSFSDEGKIIPFLNKEKYISKIIFDNFNPKDLYYSIIPAFIDILKDEDSVEKINKFFRDRLKYEVNSNFFKFDELSGKKKDKLVIDAKKQFLKRFPDLSKK